MAWFAVRNIYHFAVKSNGVNVFEERIVCFVAETEPEAHEKGQKEAAQYAANNDFAVGPDQYAYRQDGQQLIDGYEVFSQLFESTESPETFFENRYERYEYQIEK
ncbi:MAG: DUF4288 domain-containing protein [Pseudomonadota bacterium]